MDGRARRYRCRKAQAVRAIVDSFAQLSGDDYWIHTDPERARKHSPFGGTIAHGALVQILQSRKIGRAHV